MGDDDKLTLILLQVGETKGKVSGMAEDLAQIKGRMGAVVTRGECTGKHRQLEDHFTRTVGEVREEVRRGVAELRRGTGQAHAAITPALLAAAAAASGTSEMSPEQMEAALLERAEDRAEKRRKVISWYLGTGAAVVALLGVLGTFVYKMVLTLDRVQITVAAQPDAIRREIRQAAAKVQPPKVIYLPAPPKPGFDPDGTPRRAVSPPRRQPR